MLKLFISYSHTDSTYIQRFLTCIDPLKELLELDVWYDRDIKAGDDFWDEIDKHLADRDIVCLMLSPEYLASRACKEEMRRALLMHDELGTLVIPIPLRPSAWLDYEKLKRLLAGTTDGLEISKFNSADDAWMDVYSNLKTAISQYKNLKELCFSDEFAYFLNDATILAKAHSQKNELTLSDIFIYPEFRVIDNNNNDKKVSSEKVIKEFVRGERIAIIGDDQSGKSALLKVLISNLKKRCFIPLYIKDPMELLQGDLHYRISNLFKSQYRTETDLFQEYDIKRIVPVVDDFHKTKNKEKILQRLSKYESTVLVIDDIFSLDVSQDMLIADFKKFKIKELKPSLRNKLVKKWLSVREGQQDDTRFSNAELAQIDKLTQIVETSLGKAMGAGIMPAYPYFILFFLSTFELGERPIDQKITSQGYCYQALIYMFLRKQGVNNDNIDTYINFLTELAHHIYQNHGRELSVEEYDDFVSTYEKKFNLTEPKKKMLSVLSKSGIISISSLNNYSFNYPYLYYFFAGKYFAQLWDDAGAKEGEQAREEVGVILDNLHKSENAYITIFIAHHTKSTTLTESLMTRVNGLFPAYEPASLDETSLSVFSRQTSSIPEPSLPAESMSEHNRQAALARQDEIEEQVEIKEKEFEKNDDEFSKEFRRGIKTVEVVGSIIKNRAGSFSQEQLCNMFRGAMDIHLRQLTAFLAIVEVLSSKDNYADFLYDKVKKAYPNISDNAVPQVATNIFWALNFATVIGFIKKTSSSLGSSKLLNISARVCDERATPSAFMLKHTILMWYAKNLKLSELVQIDKILKSPVAKSAMLWLITDYCVMHRIAHKDIEKLVNIGIKRQKLLPSLVHE